MTDNDVVVSAHSVTKVYGDIVPVRALDNLNLTVHQGEFLAVMGPSGSGKSTLLHLCGALDRPTAGRLVINGDDLATVRSLDRFRSETVGFVFQLHNLIPTLTARENVEVPLYETRMNRRERRQRAEELLAQVGLSGRSDHLPSQLSGGQRQKVAIARALANDPVLILADEPTGNLDSASGQEIITLLQELNATRNTTIILVTHDPAVARRSRRVVTLQDGRITADRMVKNPYLEDLYNLKCSPLGRLLLQGTTSPELDDLDLHQLIPQFRQVLDSLPDRLAQTSA